MIWINFLVSRQKYDALMKFMFAGEVDLPEYPGQVFTDIEFETDVPISPWIPHLGLEAVLSRVQIPEDFVECEVDGYSNCFEFIKTLELGCPESRLSDENTDSPDECRDEADQFLTTFTWTCPTRSGLISAPQLYMVELRTRDSWNDPADTSASDPHGMLILSEI